MTAHMRSLFIAFVLGRLVKKHPGPLAWVVIGTNLVFGLMVIRWLANQRLPSTVPARRLRKDSEASRLFATFLPEEAPQG